MSTPNGCAFIVVASLLAWAVVFCLMAMAVEFIAWIWP